MACLPFCRTKLSKLGSIGNLMQLTFKEAVEEVIDEHARLGLRLHVWRNGKVVGLSALEVRARPDLTQGK
jgi:hypothetical protein